MVACEILLKAYFISWSLVSLLAPLIKIKKKGRTQEQYNTQNSTTTDFFS